MANLLLSTVMTSVGIAAMNVISKLATTRSLQVNNEQFSSELDYQVSLALAETLLKSGLLSNEEFIKTRAMLLKEYNPVLGSLFAQIG